VGIQGVAMVSAETPSENMYALQPINERTGGRYFRSNSAKKGFRRLLSADKLIFRLKKATKVASKLLRPFFWFKRATVFIN